MLSFIHRHFLILMLTALLLCGVAAGHLTTTLLGSRLAPKATVAAPFVAPQPTARGADLLDYETILQRNLFDAEHPGALSFKNPTPNQGAPVGPRSNLILLGTIAGSRPLALVRLDGANKVLHVGDEVGGGKVAAIERHLLRIRNRDGSEELITPPQVPVSTVASGAPTSASKGGYTVRNTASNRYAIPREEAERARGNLNELLKQARMEPNIVAGRTEGFEVKMVRPDSLFTMLGIQKGDIVMQVNGVALDGPEKALQVFQQLREARHIAIDLKRGGTPQTIEYDLE